MQHIDDILLYNNPAGQPALCPVLQIGTGAPHTVLVALQHGWELIGLDTALQTVANAPEVQGTITLLAAANPLGYLDRSRFVAAQQDPMSGITQNLNRVHPGNTTGTISEQSAAAIDAYISGLQPDFVLDLHAYASQSVPHAILDPCDGELQHVMQRYLQTAQIAWYREFEGETLQEQVLTSALSAVWLNRGVPALTIELGPLDSFSVEESQAAQQTLRNMLISIGAMNGAIAPTTYLDTSQPFSRNEIRYTGAAGGYIRYLVPILTQVQEGEAVAEIIALNGNIVDIMYAENDGVVFIWHDEYRVMSGSVIGILLTTP